MNEKLAKYFFNTKQRGEIHYTLLEGKIISFLFAILHIHCSTFSAVIYCHHRYPASDGYMAVILVVFGL